MSGVTDMPTMFYVFTEEDGTIVDQLVDVPTFSGSTEVVYALPGPLDHIVVSPDTALLAAGGSQQFTAQGYDADRQSHSQSPLCMERDQRRGHH